MMQEGTSRYDRALFQTLLRFCSVNLKNDVILHKRFKDQPKFFCPKLILPKYQIYIRKYCRQSLLSENLSAEFFALNVITLKMTPELTLKIDALIVGIGTWRAYVLVLKF